MKTKYSKFPLNSSAAIAALAISLSCVGTSAHPVKEPYDSAIAQRTKHIETLARTQPSRSIRVRIVFHGPTRAEQLAGSLDGSRLALRKLSYRADPANAEDDLKDGERPAAAFARIQSTRSAQTQLVAEAAKNRLVNATNADQDELKRQSREANWAHEDVDKRGIKYLAMEVVGTAPDIASFFQARLFVDTVAWIP